MERKELKKEVFKTIATLELMADFIDLFTVKFSTIEAEFFGINRNISSDKRIQ